MRAAKWIFGMAFLVASGFPTTAQDDEKEKSSAEQEAQLNKRWPKEIRHRLHRGWRSPPRRHWKTPTPWRGTSRAF